MNWPFQYITHAYTEQKSLEIMNIFGDVFMKLCAPFSLQKIAPKIF